MNRREAIIGLGSLVAVAALPAVAPAGIVAGTVAGTGALMQVGPAIITIPPAAHSLLGDRLFLHLDPDREWTIHASPGENIIMLPSAYDGQGPIMMEAATVERDGKEERAWVCSRAA
jgi:uncharacterized membrane protein YdfJ with MMPL/SSD domain